MLASTVSSHPAWSLSVGFLSLCFPLVVTGLPISLGQVLATDNVVVLAMASSCNVYHILCPPNLTPVLFQFIRTQPSLTSSSAYVNFWISYLPFLATESWAVSQFLHLHKPVILPFLLYYGCFMLVWGPLETSSSQSSIQEVVTAPFALGFKYMFADLYPAPWVVMPRERGWIVRMMGGPGIRPCACISSLLLSSPLQDFLPQFRKGFPYSWIGEYCLYSMS